MQRQFAVKSLGLALTLAWAAVGSAQTTDTTDTGSTTGTGTQGAGTITPGTLNLGAGSFMGSDATVLQRNTPGQFVGGNVQGVGNLRGQVAPGTGATGLGQMNTFGMMGGMGGMNTLNNLYANSVLNNLSRQRRQLRVPITSGVEFTTNMATLSTPAIVGQRVQSQLVRIPQVRNSGSVKIEMHGPIAVVRGEVKSEHDRDLIGRLLLLEPGVADVRNELVVTQSVPRPAP